MSKQQADESANESADSGAGERGEPAIATDGRTIGPRARATRRRLLDATARLLERDGLFDVRLVDITQDVGASPATFYQYFTDIDDALLALSDDVVEASAELVSLLANAWTPDDEDQVRDFVGHYVAYWDEHGPVLRARNLKAEEGDERFREKRRETQVPMLRSLAAMVRASAKAGRLSTDIDPVATAAAMLAMLERLVSYRQGLELRGTSAKATEATLARILFQTVTGG